MILVDIYVPSIDKEYDFQLNETAHIYTIIEEIVEMIGQKEQTQLCGNVADMMLCVKGSQRVLQKKQTLAETGVGTGESLILI